MKNNTYVETINILKDLKTKILLLADVYKEVQSFLSILPNYCPKCGVSSANSFLPNQDNYLVCKECKYRLRDRDLWLGEFDKTA